MTVTEKAAYIKGLFEGLKFDKETDEGKLFTQIIDLLEDLALSVQDLDDITAEIGEAVDEVSDDLADLEDDFYGEEDCDCCDCGCDDAIYEVECPACGEKLCLDEDILDEGSITCPACGEELELDFDGEDEDSED